jgi:fructose-bisphosphate aldolase class I
LPEAGLVPIVEPEVLMDGNHSLDTCFGETEETLSIVFHELFKQGVMLEGMILKPNMVISALDCPEQASVEEVAEATVECFLRVVPSAVPGICFLSGGQSELAATQHLNAMNAMNDALPWKLSFSYGRALQAAALNAWGGKSENIPEAQKHFTTGHNAMAPQHWGSIVMKWKIRFKVRALINYDKSNRIYSSLFIQN